MLRVCAWCNKPMSPVRTGGKASKNLVTHSVCSDCADNLDFQLGVSLKEYLDSLKIPIIALNSNGAVIAINSAALSIYKDKSGIELIEWKEKVFECAHVRLPEGCRKAVHCSGCAIRFVAADTFRSGESQYNVPALLDHCSADLNEETELLISADKIDNIVFLRIVRL